MALLTRGTHATLACIPQAMPAVFSIVARNISTNNSSFRFCLLQKFYTVEHTCIAHRKGIFLPELSQKCGIHHDVRLSAPDDISVKVVDSDGTRIEKMSFKMANRKAFKEDLKLCKLPDNTYKLIPKSQYREEQLARKTRKVKSLQVRVSAQGKDFDVAMKRIRKYVMKNTPVKVELGNFKKGILSSIMDGATQALADTVTDKIIEEFEDIAEVTVLFKSRKMYQIRIKSRVHEDETEAVSPTDPES